MEEYEALSFAAGVGFRGELGALTERATDVALGQAVKGEFLEPEDTKDNRDSENGNTDAVGLNEPGYEVVEVIDSFPAGLRGTSAMALVGRNHGVMRCNSLTMPLPPFGL